MGGIEKDPVVGMYVGPDGCHYDTIWEALWCGRIGMCGCGSPEAGFNFLRSVLAVCDRRSKTEWLNASQEIAKLVASNPHVAAEVLLHFLNARDLLEHGGSVAGSWLTDYGIEIVDAEPASMNGTVS